MEVALKFYFPYVYIYPIKYKQKCSRNSKAILKYKTKTSCMRMRINRKWLFGPNLPKFGVGILKILLRIRNQLYSEYCVCQFSGKTVNIEFLGSNLAKNEFWNQNLKTLSPHSELTPPRYHLFQFSGKTNSFTFSAQIFPKMDLGLEIQKTDVGISISILEIPYVSIFRQNKQL